MIKRWNTLLIRLWKIGRNQEVNEMTKTELKANITKIKKFLKQRDYGNIDTGIELARALIFDHGMR